MTDEQTRISFSMMVEKHAKDLDTSYLAALTEMVDQYGIEIVSVNNYLTRTLKEKIEIESYNLNLFKDEKPVSLLDI